MEIGETDPRYSVEAGGLFSNMAGFLHTMGAAILNF